MHETFHAPASSRLAQWALLLALSYGTVQPALASSPVATTVSQISMRAGHLYCCNAKRLSELKSALDEFRQLAQHN